MDQVDLFTNTDIKLAEHAEVIRALGKRAVADIIEIGRRLIDAKERCGHGGWLPWLEREFGWSDQTARRFMQVGEASKSNNLLNLSVDVSGLYLLAAPSTPTEVIDAVAERSEHGETVSLNDVKRMIAEAREADRGRIAELAEAVETASEAASRVREQAEKEREAERKKTEARMAELKVEAEVAAVKAERQKTEDRIAKLTAEYDAQIAQLREDAAKVEPSLTLDEVEALVAKAVTPLKEKIEKLKERLKREPTKIIPDPHGLLSMRVRMDLESLVKHMAMVTPAQKIESQQITTKITDQPVLVGLADDIKHARLAIGWLQEFINEVEKLK